jgi:hypothetical protein
LKSKKCHKTQKMKLRSFIRSVTRFFVSALLLLICQNLIAQQPPTMPDTSKMKYNQLSAGLGLYVFPAKSQSPQQQKKDEFDCYKWAMEQSGIDPNNLPKDSVAIQSGPTGGAVRGGARGAAAGAAIGAIAGDAGKGAAIGAVAGGLGGRRAGKQRQAAANQQAVNNAENKQKELRASFIKGFSACMEGKGYTIK